MVNQVEYQVYDEDKNPLDLSLCDNANIQVFYNLKNNTSFNISYYSFFKENNIDILNINDSFFNYICSSYSYSNNDVDLEDRINDIYQNYSLCDKDCIYNNFNLENMTISCDCKVKTNISLNETSQNIIYFDDIKIDSNFGLIKCYNLVFSLQGKLNNSGFLIFLILEIIHIPLLFYFFCKGIKGIKEYLFNEMKINGYIINNSKENKNLKVKNSYNKAININFPPLKYNKNHNKDKTKKLKVIDNSSLTNIKSSKEIIKGINNNSKINDNKKKKEKKKKKIG